MDLAAFDLIDAILELTEAMKDLSKAIGKLEGLGKDPLVLITEEDFDNMFDQVVTCETVEVGQSAEMYDEWIKR